jgi:hypothetical protein
MNSAAGNVPPKTDAVVNMWVTQEAYDKGFYEELYHFVESWLHKWPFQRPFISNPTKPEN